MWVSHMDSEKQTGYYKNRYQQSSQEQMVDGEPCIDRILLPIQDWVRINMHGHIN